MEELWENVQHYFSLYGWNVIGAILILIIGRIVTGVIVGVVDRVMQKSNIDGTLTRFVLGLTKALLMTFVVLAALERLGVETTSFIAILGAAGLAVGFALQGSLSNFAAGVMLIIFRPFKEGDYVEAGGVSGSVMEVGIFTSILKTPDNKKVIVPNGQITSDAITNYSAHDTRRIDMVFGIGYDDDMRKARQIMQDIISADERVLKDPAPQIAVSELGDSSVNFVVRPWVNTPDYWAVRFDLIEKIKAAFDEQGISIPFPQRDVHVYETKAS